MEVAFHKGLRASQSERLDRELEPGPEIGTTVEDCLVPAVIDGPIQHILETLEVKLARANAARLSPDVIWVPILLFCPSPVLLVAVPEMAQPKTFFSLFRKKAILINCWRQLLESDTNQYVSGEKLKTVARARGPGPRSGRCDEKQHREWLLYAPIYYFDAGSRLFITCGL